jgi:hypothetical protein
MAVVVPREMFHKPCRRLDDHDRPRRTWDTNCSRRGSSWWHAATRHEIDDYCVEIEEMRTNDSEGGTFSTSWELGDSDLHLRRRGHSGGDFKLSKLFQTFKQGTSRRKVAKRLGSRVSDSRCFSLSRVACCVASVNVLLLQQEVCPLLDT